MSSIIKYRNVTVETNEPVVIGSVAKNKNTNSDMSTEEQEDSLMDRLEKLANKIEDAEKRYNEIVNESDRIMFDTKNQAEKILNDAKEDGIKQGYLDGKNNANQELEEAKIALQDEFDLKLQELQQEKKEFLVNTKNEISEIFRNAFTKVFENEIKYSNELLEILIVKGLRELSDEKEVRILLSEEDYRKLNKESFQAKIIGDFSDKSISISYDKNLKNGSCLLETSLGYVDASLDNLANLVSTLIDNSITEHGDINEFMDNNNQALDQLNNLSNETNNID